VTADAGSPVPAPEPGPAVPVHPAVHAAQRAADVTRPLPGVADSGAPPGTWPPGQGTPRPMTADEQRQAVTAIAVTAGNISDLLLHMGADAVPGGPSAQLLGQAAGHLKKAFACLAQARSEGGHGAAAVGFPEGTRPAAPPERAARAGTRAGAAQAATAAPGQAR
jgi:hypothetical protein